MTFGQGGFGGGMSGSSANAGASTSTFSKGGLGGGFSGSSANAGNFKSHVKSVAYF